MIRNLITYAHIPRDMKGIGEHLGRVCMPHNESIRQTEPVVQTHPPLGALITP